MDISFWKACALVLLTVILAITIGKSEKDFALLLSMTTCCLVSIAAISYLKPVITLLWEIAGAGNLQDGFVKILLRCVGIALAVELVCMICSDAGNAALGKAVQFLGSAVMLSLGIPVFRGVLMLIQEILGEL